LIEDIGNSDRVSPAAMTKATLVHPNDPLVTLFLYTPLSMQGIVTGDTLTLLVRHAKIHDPFDTQHLVAYREEDTMLYLLATLLDISPMSPDSEISIYHNGLRLKPSSRFHECNLPHEPTLHVRFSSHSDSHPRNEQAQPVSEDAAEGSPPALGENSLLVATGRETQREQRTTGKFKGERGMALGISPTQIFVLDLKG